MMPINDWLIIVITCPRDNLCQFPPLAAVTGVATERLQESILNKINILHNATKTLIFNITVGWINKKGLLTPAKRAIAAPPGESEYNSGSGRSDVFFIPHSYSAPPLPMLRLEFQGAVPRQETRVMGLH